ncbi:MAG: glycosyltransferase family 2 protein, partial [Acidimicrobiia bacterium]
MCPLGESPSVSVVICAYTEERWDDLLEAVQSVGNQEPQALETIVVIDHNDALYGRALVALDGCTVITNSEERGLSGARNTGITAAKGDIIIFLDDDAAAEPGWIARLVAPFQDERVLGVGGSAVPVWAGGAPDWFPTEFNWVVGCSYTGMPDRLAEIRNLMGCNMAFRREVFEAVGGFRSGIGRVGKRPVGCEETELCIRARQHFPRGVFLFDPEAVVRH